MTLIKRYAEGFLEYTKDSIGFEQSLEELKNLREVFRENSEFKEFLENPAINYMEKCDTIEKVMATGFSQEITYFLKLLLKKGRIDRFEDIAEYARVKYSHGKRIKALLNTSYLLDTDMIALLKGSLEKKLHSGLQLYVNITPEILGGIRVLFENKILDGSVKKRLEDMKRKLMAVKVA